jgi:hypothetical protein
VTPNWCISYPDCWRHIVQKWCSEEWEENHVACRERRLMMPGVAHHQGSRNLSGYAEAWVRENCLFHLTLNYVCFLIILLLFSQSSSHGGQPCNLFTAFALSHKGKATSDVSYNPEDGPEAYSNASIHSRLSDYTSMAREVHGPEYDPTTEDLDTEIVMRVGGGKKKGRYWIADGAIDSSSTPTLSQIRARSTSASPAIRPRQDTSRH